jgi:hypothetical protein
MQAPSWWDPKAWQQALDQLASGLYSAAGQYPATDASNQGTLHS